MTVLKLIFSVSHTNENNQHKGVDLEMKQDIWMYKVLLLHLIRIMYQHQPREDETDQGNIFLHQRLMGNLTLYISMSLYITVSCKFNNI